MYFISRFVRKSYFTYICVLFRVTSDEILLHKSYDSDDSILSIESGSDSSDLDTNDVKQPGEVSSENDDSDDEGSDTEGITKSIKFSHTKQVNILVKKLMLCAHDIIVGILI